MKDDFNLEQVLGKISAVISGKGYYRHLEEPLKILIKHTDDPDTLDAFKGTIDFVVEKAGTQETLYMLHGLIALAPAPELQQWLVDQWKEVLASTPEDSKDSVQSYLRHAAGTTKDGDPLEKFVIPAWSASVDSAKLDDDLAIRMALHIDRDGANNQLINIENLSEVAIQALSDDIVFPPNRSFLTKSLKRNKKKTAYRRIAL